MRLHHGSDSQSGQLKLEENSISLKRSRRSPRIEQKTALRILQALHRYAETGEGRVKSLHGEFEGLLRLRVGNHRVFFDETADAITIHRVLDRKDAYR
jgi:mRNA-degrading endonuclease RelE of RelBE toxin-antitoxin system